MTNTRTMKKTNHYFMVGLTTLAMVAAMLLTINKPSYAASDTFTVTFDGDWADMNPGDGICDVSAATSVDCTLRAAIQETNATPEKDTINFDINASGWVATISPDTRLPDITAPVIINGYTQQGASANTKAVGDDASLKVQLDGNNGSISGNADLVLTHDGSGSVIKGLVMNGCSSCIRVAEDSVGTRIQGNFIGTDPTGTVPKGSSVNGVDISNGASGTLVGGSSPGLRNIISGNDVRGVIVTGNADGTRIKGNYVGTTRSGTGAIGNGDAAISINDASNTTVGGTTLASRNVISGNKGDGVEFNGNHGSGHDNSLLGNLIGTTADGAGALGNKLAGVGVVNGSTGNKIGDGTQAGSNTIAFNGLDGINVSGTGSGVKISRNSVFSNGGLGIDLLGLGEDFFSTDVSTSNDTGDNDSGPNGLQNRPVLSSAKTGGGKTTIAGMLSSNPNRTFTIEFYSNPTDTNEGRVFIGEKTITTTTDGLRSFTFSPATKVAVGRVITATATGSEGTSEFSAPRTVTSS
jgi:hypothetical protein